MALNRITNVVRHGPCLSSMLPLITVFFFFFKVSPLFPTSRLPRTWRDAPSVCHDHATVLCLDNIIFSLNSRLNCTSSGNPFLNPQTQLCYFDTGSHHTMDFSFLTISVPIVSICNYLLILKPPLSQDLRKCLSSSEAQ